MEIKGKRVLITGAGRGLGHTLVIAFLDAGAAEVLAGVRSAQDIERLRDEAKSTNSRVTPIKLDVTSDEDAQSLVQLEPIDILVNNAGIAAFGNPLTMDFADIQTEIEINYLGALRVARALAPGMSRQGQGMIVNVGSILGKINMPLVGSYSATKAALLSIGQAMRAYLNESGVKVMTVMPSTIDTDMTVNSNVPKLTKEFVAAEILKAIRDEAHDPVIGEEAQRVIAGLNRDPLAMEEMFSQFK